MAEDTQQGPYLVQAVYSFKGKNNDELCFKKGDIITLTQLDEGGWWEGTLGDKTGWFPSNYVKEYKTQADTLSSAKLSPVNFTSQQAINRAVVLKDMIDSEQAYVAELQALFSNFLHPLENSKIMTSEEYKQLVGNITEIIKMHQELMATLEECASRPSSDQRVGKIFLNSAPHLKQVHMVYCSGHPKAVCILEKYKDDLGQLMESCGAASPGLLVLTTALSKPFRRLEKYCGMLQELGRHVEENHPDRGDILRSVSVYKDIASSCSVTRRQKELELEVLRGGVRGWEGEDLVTLGEILHMGSVAVGPQHTDRYLLLFQSMLVILSVSHRMSGFIYEGKLPLTGITVNKLEDSEVYKNAFEIIGPMIDKIVAVCQTKEDQQTWVEKIRFYSKNLKKTGSPSSYPSSSLRLIAPAPSPSRSITPVKQTTSTNKRATWSITCLRPLPPHNPLSSRDEKSPRSPKKLVDLSYEEDAQILRVIEEYSTCTKTRHNINSVDLGSLYASAASPCRNWYNHKPTRRASAWCCGSHLLLRTLAKQHLE
nr:PREDICTED: rho guanine nucleotide exchange factor 7 isoform X1 [Bemisia tabaci]